MNLPKVVILVILVVTLVTLIYSISPEIKNSFRVNNTAGSCKILEEEFCSKGEVIIQTLEGNQVKYLGWKNLPSGTQVFSPIDGLRTTIPSPQGQFLSVYPPDRSVNYNFIGDIVFASDATVEVGRVIGHLGDSTVKGFGEYDLVFTITKLDLVSKKAIVDTESLEKLFPDFK
jgi:hypothetical protein